MKRKFNRNSNHSNTIFKWYITKRRRSTEIAAITTLGMHLPDTAKALTKKVEKLSKSKPRKRKASKELEFKETISIKENLLNQEIEEVITSTLKVKEQIVILMEQITSNNNDIWSKYTLSCNDFQGFKKQSVKNLEDCNRIADKFLLYGAVINKELKIRGFKVLLCSPPISITFLEFTVFLLLMISYRILLM